VKKIYAAARKVDSLPKFGDARVVPVTLDITNHAQIAKAAQQASDTDVLINNAGVATVAWVVTGTPEQLKNDMDVQSRSAARFCLEHARGMLRFTNPSRLSTDRIFLR
jgi:NADP-dependent 3-hydroxy acid dehydrogenase YdfG